MDDTAKRREPFAPAVVITGPTQGIGRALAEEFARDGHTLVLVARDEQKLAATARSLTEAHGVGVRVFACDLGRPEGGAELEAALRRFGLYADILVNNAALMAAGFFQDADPAKLRANRRSRRAGRSRPDAPLPAGHDCAAEAAACSTSPRSRASCRSPIRRPTPPPRPSCSRSPARSPTRPWAPACTSRRLRRARPPRRCTPRPAPNIPAMCSSSR